MRIALLLVLVTPAFVAADAIMPLPGPCPTGSEVGIRNHAEACIPINCTESDNCPDGSSCVALCTCLAERERHGRGGSYTAVEEIGRCNASDECDEGDVLRRSECQPSEDEPSEDEPSEDEPSEDEPVTMEPAPSMQASARAPAEEESGGCSTSGTGSAFGFAALLLFTRRR